jgi:hypothetical protein
LPSAKTENYANEKIMTKGGERKMILRAEKNCMPYRSIVLFLKRALHLHGLYSASHAARKRRYRNYHSISLQLRGTDTPLVGRKQSGVFK